MKKPPITQPAASAITSIAPGAPSASGDWTIKFDRNANLNVTVASPDKPLKIHSNLRWFITAVVIVAFFWILLNVVYVIRNSESQKPVEFRDAKLDVAISYPVYATFEEETELLMNITNRSAEKFSGEVTLLFPGVIPTFPMPGETATAKLEKLPPGSRQSHKIKFAVRREPAWFNSGAIPIKVQVITDDCAFQTQTGPDIALAHIGLPIRAINNFLTGPVGLAIIGAFALLLWEVARKAIFKWEAK